MLVNKYSQSVVIHMVSTTTYWIFSNWMASQVARGLIYSTATLSIEDPSL